MSARLRHPAAASQPRAVLEQQTGPVEGPIGEVVSKRGLEQSLRMLVIGDQGPCVGDADLEVRRRSATCSVLTHRKLLASFLDAPGVQGGFGELADPPP